MGELSVELKPIDLAWKKLGDDVLADCEKILEASGISTEYAEEMKDYIIMEAESQLREVKEQLKAIDDIEKSVRDYPGAK